MLAAVVAVAMTFALLACTPRADTGENVAQNFLDALSKFEVEQAAKTADRPSAAETDIQAAVSGLQAQGFVGHLGEVTSDGTQSTIVTEMQWQLPNDRVWQYETKLLLTKTDGAWALRWAPNLLHPQLGNNQHPELRSVAAPRASVVGSDGATLLEPGMVHRVVLDRSAVTNVQSSINRIATIVNNELDPDTLDARAAGKAASAGSGPYSVLVLPGSTPDQVKERLASIDGVTVNDEAAMVRPDAGFAPDLMSRLESAIDDTNVGVDGWQVVAANPNGAVVKVLYTVAPQVQPAIRASISKKVQDAAQQAVDSRSDAQAMIVAIAPSTGDILAVAQTAEADKQGDLALSGQFPPGSTFKIITAAAGVNRLGLNADSVVPCPGTMEIGTRIVTNYNGQGGGNTSLDSAFARSCNTTFGDIAYQLEEGQLQQEAAQFGIGVDYHVAGLSTITGSVSKGEDPAEKVDAGYGQGYDLTSPFGMALASATVARGVTPTPRLIHTSGTVQDQVSQPLDEHTLAELRRMMRSVVTSGTATGISSRGEIYAKTGEAEVAGGSHSWFTGYRDDIAFATLIVHGGGSEHAIAITDAFFANLDAVASLEPQP